MSMAATGPDLQAIRRWAESELPGVSCPSDNVLSFLSAGPAARDLWHFLTTRVRSERNAHRVRSALALAEIPPSAASNETSLSEELQSVQADIAAAEEEIRQLRAELRQDDGHDTVCGTGENGIREGELRNAFAEALKRVEEEKGRQIDDALAALEAAIISEMEQYSDDDGQDMEPPANPLSEALHEFAGLLAEADYEGEGLQDVDLGALQERLQEICGRLPMSRVADTLASDARRSVGKVRSACISCEDAGSPAMTAAEATEQVARDAQLSAYAVYDGVVSECVRAEKRVAEEAQQLGDGGEARTTLLCAQLEGERAVVAFARQEMEGEEEDKEAVAILRKEVRRGNERTERIDRAMKQLLEGNRALLEEAVRTRKALENRVDKELRDVQNEAVDGAEVVLAKVETIRGKVDDGALSELLCGGGVDGGGGGGGDVESVIELADRVGRVQALLFRRTEALAREGGQVRIAEGLRLHVGVCGEAWERMLAHMEEGVLPQIRVATEEARRCRESEAVYVQDELRNWVRAPGREVAKQLGLLKKGRRRERGGV